MSVLDRAALEDSPLADLHTIASEMTIDGYRRLRKAALIDAILERAGVTGATAAETAEADADADAVGSEAEVASAAEVAEVAAATDVAEEGEEAESVETADTGETAETDDAGAGAPSGEATRRRRGRRGGRGRGAAREDAVDATPEPELEPEPEPEPEPAVEAEIVVEAEPEVRPEAADVQVEGVVELLANGSGFIRSTPGETSDDDVYISATQVKRCELVTGDRVAGPKRSPRRSERFASLVRVDTINGRPATDVVDSTRYDELPLAFPSEHLHLESEDPTLRLLDWLTPIGRGSRVTITGGARSGKTELLRRIATTLAAHADLQLLIALAGVRPEEITEWSAGAVKPVTAVSFGVSADGQDQAVELVVDQARRIAARGGHAVVVIDSLDGLHPQSARKLTAAARKIVDGGSLTLIATASQPIGGETTVIALDVALTSAGRFPALDVARSGTLRPELLLGEDAARAIERAHAELLPS